VPTSTRRSWSKPPTIGVRRLARFHGALTVALVWEWCAIRRTLADHRRRTVPDGFWRDHVAVTIPERRP
jgi:hypothetical protein